MWPMLNGWTLLMRRMSFHTRPIVARRELWATWHSSWGASANNISIPLTSSSALLLFLDIRRKKLRTASLALFFDRPLSRPRRSDNEDESSSRMKSPSDIIPSRFCRSNDHRRHSLYERISQLILQRIDGNYSPIDSSSHQNSSLDWSDAAPRFASPLLRTIATLLGSLHNTLIEMNNARGGD